MLRPLALLVDGVEPLRDDPFDAETFRRLVERGSVGFDRVREGDRSGFRNRFVEHFTALHEWERGEVAFVQPQDVERVEHDRMRFASLVDVRR